MKRLFKRLSILVALLVVALFALQLFLNHGLNPVVQKALPEVSQSLGLDVGIGDISLNLFGGSLTVQEVSIKNPKGFPDPTVFALDKTRLDVSLRALTSGVLEVSEATVKNAKVTLVRNQAGELNLKQIREALPEADPNQKMPTEPKQPKTPEAEPTEAKAIPRVQINNLAFNTLFEFIDYTTTNATPLRVGLDLVISANAVTTFGSRPEAEWGSISIGGSLHENPKAFVTDVTAHVAPLSDPIHASFNAMGQIMDVDMHEVESLTDAIGLASSSANIAIQLTVRDGLFLSGSELVLSLRNAELTGDLKAKHGDVKLPADISLTIPVSGSLENPVINIQQAITISVIRNLTKNPDYLLDNVTVDGKSLRQRLNKALGGSSKDKADGNTEEAPESEAIDETVNDAIKKLGDLFK